MGQYTFVANGSPRLVPVFEPRNDTLLRFINQTFFGEMCIVAPVAGGASCRAL